MNAKDIISKHSAEFTGPPQLMPHDASVDAPLLGNGDMTVALGGSGRALHFILSKNDLWCLKHKYGQSCPLAFRAVGDTALRRDGSFTVTPDAPVTLVLAMESVFKHQNPLQAAKNAVLQAPDPADLYAEHTAWWAGYWEKSFVSLDDPEIEKQYYLSLYGMGSCSRDPDFPPPIFGDFRLDDY